MSYSNGSTGEGRWPTSTQLPGYGRGQTTESEYPDPSLLHNPSTSSGYRQRQFYNEVTSSSSMQQDNKASFYENEHWPIQSQEVNRLLAGMDPALSLEAYGVSGISGGPFHDQPSVERMRQTIWDNHYSAPPFPETNFFPEQIANNGASEGYPLPSTGQTVYNPNGLASEHYDAVAQPSAAVGSSESPTPSQPSEQKNRRSLRSRPSRSKPSSAVNTGAPGNGGELSKLGQRRAALGGRWGNDRREKAPIQRVDGVLYGWVDGQWERAGYHCDFREKLIRMDAEQPGAPVFQEGSSLNCTSYSPVTREWTSDPASVTDSKGRHVHFLRTRPAELHHDPAHGYLRCEGLVMLDHNDRAIKAFPGAPRTLSTDTPGWLLESLRRVFDMSYPDPKPTGPNVARVPAKRRQNQAAFWDNWVVEPDTHLQAEAQRAGRGSLVRPGKGQGEGKLTL